MLFLSTLGAGAQTQGRCPPSCRQLHSTHLPAPASPGAWPCRVELSMCRMMGILIPLHVGTTHHQLAIVTGEGQISYFSYRLLVPQSQDQCISEHIQQVNWDTVNPRALYASFILLKHLDVTDMFWCMGQN